jgi:sec-independent protein translocase protein TatC
MLKERKKYDPNALTFLEHLEEFRKRIISIAVVLAVLTGVGFFFSREIVDFLLRPGAALIFVADWAVYLLGNYGVDLPGEKIGEILAPLDITFQFIKPTEGFATHLQVAFIAAIITASPFVFWHLWRFITPALMPREKRMVIPFVFFTVVCFLTGVAVGYTLLIPALKFFQSFETEQLKAFWSINAYITLVTHMMFGVGLVFETPILVYFLARLGIVDEAFLIRQWKYIILGSFITAAILTPTADMVTCSALALPLIGLYVISILVAWVFYPRDLRKQRKELEKEIKAGDNDEPDDDDDDGDDEGGLGDLFRELFG